MRTTETLTVSAEGVAKAARNGAAAMVIQHMGGYPVDGAELAAAAGISADNVVEDAAHGLGATVGARPVGSFSRAACFSFYATKNLPIGEGGALTTTDGDLAERWRRMRLHGMSRDAWRRYDRSGTWRYTVEDAGMKANFTDLQAAIGREQLHHLTAWQQRRSAIAARYDAQLGGIRGLELPPRPAADTHAWHLYIVRIDHRAFGMDRDTVSDRLAEAGIGTSVHFIPGSSPAVLPRPAWPGSVRRAGRGGPDLPAAAVSAHAPRANRFRRGPGVRGARRSRRLKGTKCRSKRMKWT